MRQWAGATLHRRPESDDGGDLRSMSPRLQAELMQILERTKKIKIERLALEGSLHNVADCRVRRLAQIQVVRSALLGLPREMAPRLTGRDETEIERLLEARIRTLLEDFATRHAQDDGQMQSEQAGG